MDLWRSFDWKLRFAIKACLTTIGIAVPFAVLLAIGSFVSAPPESVEFASKFDVKSGDPLSFQFGHSMIDYGALPRTTSDQDLGQSENFKTHHTMLSNSIVLAKTKSLLFHAQERPYKVIYEESIPGESQNSDPK